MWQDPVVEETRKRREEYAAQFNHDADAIFEDILKRQAQAGKQLVSFPSRVPPKKDLAPLETRQALPIGAKPRGL